MKKLITGAAVILLLLIEISSAFAQGALMINPKRCVFEANKRNDVVTLYNDGDDTTSYVISFKHYEMLQNGDFKEIPDSVKSDVLYCDNMVKYFPKEVTLAPHAAQTVRLQVLKPKDLVPGEYRSHLYFRAVERAKALENKRSDTDKTITLSLKAIYGLAIPIIVRSGTTPAKVSLSDLNLSPADTGGNAIFSVDINRSGNESSYGELIVTYKDAEKEVELTRVKGVGVYVPLPMRRFPIKVKMPVITSLGSGVIKIEYRSMSGDAKEATLASAEMPLKK